MFSVGVERWLVRLRLTRGARFHFNHGGALMGLLCRALGTHELPAGLAPFACESGRVQFEAGEGYYFGVTLAGASCRGIDAARVGEGLRRVGARVHADTEGPPPTLAGNFEVASIDTLPPPDVEAEAARLRSSASTLTLRFLSPLRLARPAELAVKGAGFLNRECFPPEHFVLRLAYRLFLLERGRYPDAREREELSKLLAPAPAPRARAASSELLWLDIPLEGAPGKHEEQPKGYTLGGVVGRVTLEDVPDGWLATLALGRHTHAGEKTHYGLGRYALGECGADEPFQPARTLLERVSEPTLIEEALQHVAAQSEAPGVDGYAPGDLADFADLLAERLGAELRTGAYRPAELLGFVAPKERARLRPLAIPTVRDRAAQRAACVVLGPSVETLLEDCAYAYRKGFSRAGAARAVEAAYADGYRYVLDADIDSFFDSIEWPRLFAKLEALFPCEPLMTLVEEWVRAPVVFERATIRRERGLPQGSAVAPLLANLYLDELDEELLGRDYRLVRYGDDFVVLCKDIEAARRAREDARRKLAEMGLRLNEEKTAVRSFDEGFTYLGYLFLRSLVIEQKRESPESTGDLTPEAIPRASWLAQIPFERVRSLTQRRAATGRRAEASVVSPAQAVEVTPLTTATAQALPALATPERRALYLTTPGTSVRREGETLVACAPGAEPLAIPFGSLSHVVCYGGVRVTVPVLLALAGRGVPSYFCRATGELKAVFAEPPAEWALWMAQAKMAEDDAARVRFAREIVAAKLRNFAALAVRFRFARAAEVAAELRELEQSCVNKTTVEALNGMEGRGAAVYFGALRETLAAEWGFAGRRTQPPPDPFNAMLSFGYTLLYHHLSTALVAAGLNPRIGLYHTERGTYHALACDLQEEFRHLVDAQALAMVNRREVKPEDFRASEDGRYPCLMQPDLRRKFIGAFEKRLSNRFTPPDSETTNYRLFIEAQVRQLRELIGGRIALYRPLGVRGAGAGVSETEEEAQEE